jgi:serine-type D-Ala-D-Ala carboxypeptidase
LWSAIVPTWNDTSYRHLVIQGTVSDGNAYALGGIAGHAGFFSTVYDAAMFSQRILFASPNDPLVNSTTVDYWIKAENLTQSSRALGWDTNDYKMNTYRGCGNFSPLTFTHTGFVRNASATTSLAFLTLLRTDILALRSAWIL